MTSGEIRTFVIFLFGFVALLPPFTISSISTEPPIPEILDYEPDKNCRCPFNIEPQIELCGYEMLELNRRATRKHKVKQTTCKENVVYDCDKRNTASNFIKACPAGTKCMMGNEALSNRHNELILANPDYRWCLNETGLPNS